MASVVGRETELHAVEAFLSNDDGPGVLVVVGEPGIGKTTLWLAALELARSTTATVLAAQPTESEARLPFAGLSDLLGPVHDGVFADLAEPQRDALEAALLRRTSRRRLEQRVVAAAFLSVLRAVAAETPVVVAIDDVQWLDAPSKAALEFALRRLQAERIRTIATVRAGEAGREAREMLERAGTPVQVELRPLSVAALHGIVANTLGRNLPRPTLVRVAQASSGNPLYAIEIARALAGVSAGTRLPVPESLDELVRKRVRALPATTRDALLRSAVLARPTTAAVDPSDLAAAEEAELIRIEEDGRVHFAHPLYAAAVYSSAPLAHRRAAHRAAAELVEDGDERVRHLALSAERADESLVLALEEAARRARQRGAPDRAAELTDLALTLAPAGGPQAHRLQLELAEHLYLASDFARARTLLEDLRQVSFDGGTRVRALLTLAEIDYWRAGESAALGLAEEALVAAVDPHDRARAETQIAMYAGTVDLPRAAAAARAAVVLVEGRNDADPAVLAAALAARVRADLFLGDGFDADAAQRAVSLEAKDPPAAVDDRASFKLGQWLRYVDDFDGARVRLGEAERRAQDEGDDSSLANILLNRLVLETWSGAWEEAALLVTRMDEAFAQQGVESEGIAPWRAYLDAYKGRLAEVRSVAGPRPREPVIAAIWGRCLGLAELADGDAAAADAHLAGALLELDRVDFREPAIWRVDGDAIEAAVLVGDLERAELWTRRFEERAVRSGIPWSVAVSSRCRGLVLAARGELDAGALMLERSRAEHAHCPMPFELARTCFVQGQLLRRLKRRREARASLVEAREIFERLGADRWVARTDAELQRVATRRAPGELTPTERRIAELAASGLSNPEIAARVYVSRKTVEANLARAYRKLGISSRGQLKQAIASEPGSIS